MNKFVVSKLFVVVATTVNLSATPAAGQEFRGTNARLPAMSQPKPIRRGQRRVLNHPLDGENNLFGTAKRSSKYRSLKKGNEGDKALPNGQGSKKIRTTKKGSTTKKTVPSKDEVPREDLEGSVADSETEENSSKRAASFKSALKKKKSVSSAEEPPMTMNANGAGRSINDYPIGETPHNRLELPSKTSPELLLVKGPMDGNLSERTRSKYHSPKKKSAKKDRGANGKGSNSKDRKEDGSAEKKTTESSSSAKEEQLGEVVLERSFAVPEADTSSKGVVQRSRSPSKKKSDARKNTDGASVKGSASWEGTAPELKKEKKQSGKKKTTKKDIDISEQETLLLEGPGRSFVSNPKKEARSPKGRGSKKASPKKKSAAQKNVSDQSKTKKSKGGKTTSKSVNEEDAGSASSKTSSTDSPPTASTSSTDDSSSSSSSSTVSSSTGSSSTGSTSSKKKKNSGTKNESTKQGISKTEEESKSASNDSQQEKEGRAFTPEETADEEDSAEGEESDSTVSEEVVSYNIDIASDGEGEDPTKGTNGGESPSHDKFTQEEDIENTSDKSGGAAALIVGSTLLLSLFAVYALGIVAFLRKNSRALRRFASGDTLNAVDVLDTCDTMDGDPGDDTINADAEVV